MAPVLDDQVGEGGKLEIPHRDGHVDHERHRDRFAPVHLAQERGRGGHEGDSYLGTIPEQLGRPAERETSAARFLRRDRLTPSPGG